MRNKKLLFTVFISLCLIFSATFSTSASDEKNAAVGSLQIGATVEFGKYNGAPIEWRIINKDASGNALLFSEKIISYKAFDDQFWLANTDKDYGSNYWLSSDLRAWLNSGDQTVNFPSGAPYPSKVKYGYNAYATEPGFLTNFSDAEKAAILSTTHKQLIDEKNKNAADVVDKNAPMHIYSQNINTCYTNFDTARYLNTEEKVFLLDIQELSDFVYKTGFPVSKKPTAEALAKEEQLNAGKISMYWLRSPRATYAEETANPVYKGISAKPDGTSVRIVYGSEYVLAADAYDGSIGIAPALYLKSDYVVKILQGKNGKLKDK